MGTADPFSKVACETATKDNMVMVAGEITTKAQINYEKVVRATVAKIGFDTFVDDLTSTDSKGLSHKSMEVIVRINKQSPDIAGGVHVGKDEMDVGAGDQGIMFGYASDETKDCMPLTHSMATRLGKKLTDVRKNGQLWWLRPDGKDPTKLDRSAAYICRQMAKSIVSSGLCKRGLVQLSYAIGVAKPLSLFVETYGTEQGDLNPVDVTNIIKIAFDCRPGAIALSLALREPKYQESAAYCHFGHEAVTKNGKKFFEWENAKDLSKYKSMTSAEVEAELKASNYLTKWVD